ncbi:MAG: helix-turn-helix transcriptional regulator [Candidatus Gracilibacteria bacterium]
MTSLHTKAYGEVIERLKKARINAGLTQVEVARKMKKPQSYVSKVENRQRRLDILEVRELANLYKVKLDDLI